MSFVKDTVNSTPIVDNVFGVVDMANKAAAKLGADAVTNATIGSLYDENGKLAALDVVFDSLKNLDNTHLAKYAISFTGNPAFREEVENWVLPKDLKLAREVVATPGGTGAVASSILSTLEEGQTLIIPEIAWGSYALMAQMNNLELARYSLFEEDHFNLDSFKKTCLEVLDRQNRLVVILNDPCHNPTGYSLSNEEWEQVIAFLNDCSQKAPVVLINDIAYIDFSYRGMAARDYMLQFDKISDDVAVVVCFSLSKSMTSYGLRCGAAIILAQKEESVRLIRIVMEKEARAIWSNINNGAMEMFVDVMENRFDEYDAEKQAYVDLLRQRSGIFLQEAAACGLSHYPYKEGFFITLDMDNDTRDRFFDALVKKNIYTVKVNKGIRVAICSLPIEKVKGLAPKMKEIFDSVQG